MKSVDALRELGKHTEPCIWTADDVKSAVMIEKETFDKCLDNIDREVEERYTPLPVDADGVPIHVGDVMDEQLPFGGYAAPAPVDTMELSRGAGGYGWMVRLDSESGAFINPKLLRHHHAPTVEDVLEEFVARWMETHHDDIPALKAEYAAKLRLAGEDA